jgi:hypothetical protein
MTSSCNTAISEETHEVLRLLSTALNRQGVSKVSVVQIHLFTAIPMADIRAYLDELQAAGTLETSVNCQTGTVEHVVLDPCFCEKPLWHKGFSERQIFVGGAALDKNFRGRHTRRQPSVTTQKLTCDSSQLPVRITRGVKSESVQNSVPKLSTVYLAKFLFPAMCRKHGTSQTVNGQALAGSFNRWVRDEDYSPAEIKAMIEEYFKHPEWCGKGKAPWVDFLRRKDYLYGKVQERVKVQKRRELEEAYAVDPGLRPETPSSKFYAHLYQ